MSADPSDDMVATVLAEGARRRARFFAGIALLAVALFGCATLGISLGAVHLSFTEVWATVGHHVLGEGSRAGLGSDAIIWEIRSPRVVLGALAGAGLSVVGVMVQAMVRNPLADPYVMGVESGAAAAAVGLIYLGRTQAYSGRIGPTLAGFAGAVATLVVVFALARRNGQVSSVRLLLVGVSVSYALGGLTSFFLYASPAGRQDGSVLFWILGGLGGAVWSQVPLAAAIVGAGFGLAWYHSRPLNALAVGDESATALGISPDRLRTRLLLISAVLVAALVSIVGPIGFVGLVVPHVGRMLFGADHRRLIPAALLLGAIYLVLVDLAARLVLAPSELPIGVVTSVLGTPFFLWLIRRRDGSSLREAG